MNEKVKRINLVSRAMSILSYFSPKTESEKDRRQALAIVVISMVEFTVAVFYSTFHFAWGDPLAGIAISIAGFLTITNLFFLRHTANIRVAGHVPVAVYYVSMVGLALTQGGIGAPALAWFTLTPLIALFMSSIQEAFFWATISSLTIFGLYALELMDVSLSKPLSPGTLMLQYSFATSGLLFFALLFGIANEYLKSRAYMEIYRMANEDMLTGVHNRRRFFHLAQDLFEREPHLFAVILDIDKFKTINDRYGHPAGDEVLKAFANCVSALLKDNEVFGRIGGEEFALLIAGNDESATIAHVERLRAAVENLIVNFEGNHIRFSMSCGIAGKDSVNPDNLDHLLKRADDALYAAKEEGRNRVIFRTQQGCHLLRK